jgi:hypothetical protein
MFKRAGTGYELTVVTPVVTPCKSTEAKCQLFTIFFQNPLIETWDSMMKHHP